MSLSVYSSRTFALLLFSACLYKNPGYISKEKEGYHTQNAYHLYRLDRFEETISILKSPSDITDLRKKLTNRIPKWSSSGTEKKPYELWYNFYKEEIIEKIVKKLQAHNAALDTVLLENYYNSLGKLFKEPTEENEKELITSSKKLEANTTLVQSFKTCIKEIYEKPETIQVSKSILEYQEFLYFIDNQVANNTTLHLKLRKVQSNLAQWRADGRPSGRQLWSSIQENQRKLLEDVPPYNYKQNQAAIEHSLSLIHDLANNLYTLSYKDLLEILPHGINQLNNILDQLALQLRESEDMRLLKIYLAIVESPLKQCWTISNA